MATVKFLVYCHKFLITFRITSRNCVVPKIFLIYKALHKPLPLPCEVLLTHLLIENTNHFCLWKTNYPLRVKDFQHSLLGLLRVWIIIFSVVYGSIIYQFQVHPHWNLSHSGLLVNKCCCWSPPWASAVFWFSNFGKQSNSCFSNSIWIIFSKFPNKPAIVKIWMNPLNARL